MANLLQKRLLPAIIVALLVCDFFIFGNVALAGVNGMTKLYANGSLLRASNHRVYVIVNGDKRHIVNLAELAKYRGRAIIDVSNSVLMAYDDENASKERSYADGSLLRSPEGRIFLITKGFKHHIINAAELYTYRHKQIINVTEGVLEAYDDDKVVQSYPNGSLLKGSGDSIFLITDTRKYRIKNLTELAVYKNKVVVMVSDDVLSHYMTSLSID